MKFKMSATVLIIGIPLILSGCGLWGTPQSKEQQADTKKDVNLINKDEPLDPQKDEEKKDSDKTTKASDKKTNTVARQIFLLDKKGMVVPQTLMLPKKKGAAKQSLSYLVKDGPVQNILPNGFQAVLPAGTQVLGADLKGDMLVVNFSKEFKSYKPDNEKKVLQAITWTATQFDNINNVKIWIDGVAQKTMPANGTPIGDGSTSRANGINQESSNVVDITGSQAVTLYFPAQAGNSYYYVPVTERMTADKGKIVAAVQGLIQGPTTSNGLLGMFSDEVGLIDDPTIEDGVVTLNFNKAIYSRAEKQMISKEALNSLVLSLTAQDGIQKVALQVDGKSSIKNESGKVISKPVSRPKQVNTVGL